MKNKYFNLKSIKRNKLYTVIIVNNGSGKNYYISKRKNLTKEVLL